MQLYDAPVSAAVVRSEAERFGREVIDIHWMRSLLTAIAEKLESDEKLHQGSTCQTCGMVAMHASPRCV